MRNEYAAPIGQRMCKPVYVRKVMRGMRTALNLARVRTKDHVARKTTYVLPNMFSSFRCQGTALFKGVSEKNLQRWKLCGRSSPPKCCNCFESALGLVDESSTYSRSKCQSRDAEHSCSGKSERKKSLSLGPIALPSALESALDQAMSSKSFSCVHVSLCTSTELQIEVYY